MRGRSMRGTGLRLRDLALAPRPRTNRMWNIIGDSDKGSPLKTMRPTYLEVNLSQLRQNLEAIRAHVSPAKVMPMVKANAYGHGVDGVVPFIEPYLDYIGVALVEEGIHL